MTYCLPDFHHCFVSGSTVCHVFESLFRCSKKENTSSVLVGRPEGKRPLGKPGHTCIWGIILKWI